MRQKDARQNAINRPRALRVAVRAARAAGSLLRRNWRAPKKIEAATQHDVKLALDVRCQNLIERRLRRAFPAVAFLGEEGTAGDPRAPYRWVVDPIDGTVNFAYEIPHACVSIALQARRNKPGKEPAGGYYETLVGAVLDPFCGELWTAVRGGPARLNGRPIHVSRRARLREAIVAIGFARYDAEWQKKLPPFQDLVRRVRKLRLMGSAALDLVYVASGRMDAYLECGVRLWDIAAGGLIVECAGGEFWRQSIGEPHIYHVIATNGLLRRSLGRLG
jgi:myo-inositol-1(or 4)-monophosphatase